MIIFVRRKLVLSVMALILLIGLVGSPARIMSLQVVYHRVNMHIGRLPGYHYCPPPPFTC